MVHNPPKTQKTINSLVILPSGVLSNKNFDSYCLGIKENSDSFYCIDSVKSYSSLGKNGFENHIKNIVAERNINCIFSISSGRELDIDFMLQLGRSAFIATFYFDAVFDFESRDRYSAQTADLVLVADSYLSTFKFEELGIKAICPFTFYDKGDYSIKNNVKRDINVSFVGNTKKSDRGSYINHLEKNKIAMNGYGTGSKNGLIDFGKMVDIFNRSKINLNFTGVAHNNECTINSRIKQLKGRPTEVALCGGFSLSEYTPGMEHMFEIGKEIAVFYNKEDLVEKIKYYLEHEEEREMMAKKAYARSLKDYDTISGFAKVFTLIREMIGHKKEKIIYVDDIFIRSYVTYRIYYLSKFLSKREWPKSMEEFRILLKYKRIFLKKGWELIKIFLMRNIYISALWNFLKKIVK